MTKEQLERYRAMKIELKSIDKGINSTRKSILEAQIKEIENFVERIDDKTTKEIFKMKFLQNHTNQYIAMQLGKQDEGTVRKKIKKIFKNSDFSDLDVL